MIVNCFKEVFSQYHLVVSKKTICCGKRVFQNIILQYICENSSCPRNVWGALASSPHNQFHLHCLERLVILLQTNWESGKSWRKCERPRSNETASCHFPHLFDNPVTSCVFLPSWHCKCNFLRPSVKDFHIAWPDEKKGDARWKTSPCKFTAASSVPPTGQSTTLPAFMAHRWKVNCNTLKGIWAD